MRYEIVVVTPFMQNCTLFWCEETQQAVVIDPGGDVDEIQKAITKNKLNVEKILLTHGHIDHAGGAFALAKNLNVAIWGPHKDDSFWLNAMPQQARTFGFPDVLPFEPEKWLNEGDEITFGKEKLNVLHCPGHTPGHVVFVNQKNKIMQVGDVLFQGSIGRTDFPRGNFDDLIASINNKLLPLGDDFVFVSGHGECSSLGEEKRHNPFLQ